MVCVSLVLLVIFSGVSSFFSQRVYAAERPTGNSLSAVRNSPNGSFTSFSQCLQPPTNVDHATLSNADLDKYGLPRHQPGENKATWQEAVRASVNHVCGGTPTNIRNGFPINTQAVSPTRVPATRPFTPSCSSYNIGYTNWTGNITVNSSIDGACTQNNTYTEADAVFYVPCIKSGSPTGYDANWVGLGGPIGNLVQAGIDLQTYYILGFQQYSYEAWTENLGYSNRNQINLFGISCGDRMQVFVYNDDETYIIDHNSGNYATTFDGPSANNDSAEWIVETPCVGNPCSNQPLCNFQSETFYGMGTIIGSGAYGGQYVSPADVDHIYSNMSKTNIGSLVYNTSWGPPNYANTITWKSS